MKRFCILLGIIAALSTNLASAKDEVAGQAAKDTKEEVKKTTKAKRDWYPYHGEVASVNKASMTIALKKIEGERVIHMDSKSELMREGKPATLIDVKPGDYVSGKMHKNKAGEEVITSAKFRKDAPTDAEKQKLEEKVKKNAKKEPAK